MTEESEPPIVWDWAEGRANAYVLGKDEDPANVNLARAYLALKAERDELASQVERYEDLIVNYQLGLPMSTSSPIALEARAIHARRQSKEESRG